MTSVDPSLLLRFWFVLFCFVKRPLFYILLLSLFSACNCNKQGSADLTCDANTGRCTCKPGYRGRKCDACPLGKFNFPTCSRECNIHKLSLSLYIYATVISCGYIFLSITVWCKIGAGGRGSAISSSLKH